MAKPSGDRHPAAAHGRQQGRARCSRIRRALRFARDVTACAWSRRRNSLVFPNPCRSTSFRAGL